MVETRLERSEKRTIFTLLYLYSQGDPNLQTALSEWHILKGYFKREAMISAALTFIPDFKVPKLHMAVGEVDRRDELYEGIKELQEPRKGSTEKWESYILKKTLERDLEFQKRERLGKRDMPIEEISPDSRNDKHASFLRRYALNGHPTGHHGFGVLFKTLKEMTEALRMEAGEKRNEKELLDELVTGWERNHKGHTFFP